MRAKSCNTHPRNPGRLPSANVVIAAAVLGVTLLHLWALPTVLTFDSQQYLFLASIVDRPAEWHRWDPLRTPLFILLLKGAFALLGAHAWTWLLLQGGLALATVALIGSVLRQEMPARAAAAAALGIALCPTLVAYQHLLLTEIASGFFLALLAWLCAAPESRPWRRSAALAAAAAAGYYCRPTFILLLPALALLRLLPGGSAGWSRRGAAAALPHAALVAVAPFALAYPWLSWSEQSGRSAQQLLFGLIRQAVFAPQHPLLRGVEDRYSEAVSRASVHGRLASCGLRDNEEYPLLGALAPRVARSLTLFRQAVESAPARYIDGLLRTLRCYSLPPEDRSENQLFRSLVFDRASATLLPSIPPYSSAAHARLLKPAAAPAASRVFRGLEWIYDLAAAAALFLLPAGLLIGLLSRSRVLVSMTVLALAFIAANALVLNPIDRMIVPALPLLLGFQACLIARCFRHG